MTWDLEDAPEGHWQMVFGLAWFLFSCFVGVMLGFLLACLFNLPAFVYKHKYDLLTMF